MRQLTIFVVIFFISCGVTPKTNEFIGEWVAVYNWSGFEKGVGVILNFKDDTKVIISSIGTDKKMTLDYKLEKSDNKLLIKYEGAYEPFGFLKRVTANQFTMMTPDSSENMEFRRVRETKLKFNKKEVLNTLINSSWVSKREKDSVRIDFGKNQLWDNERAPYEAMFHYWVSKPTKQKETWNIIEYGDKLFLSYTNHQSSFVIHQINDFTPSRITWTETYEADQILELVREKELTDNAIQKLRDNLSQKKWKSVLIDTIGSNEQGQISSHWDNDLLTLDQIKEPFEFKFNNDKTYLVTLSGQEWKKGLWDVTKDGEYIITDDERDKCNWIQIKQTNQNLILSKLHKIKGGRLGYKLYMITMRLE